MTHNSGRSCATSDSRLNTAKPTSSRSGTAPALSPNVVCKRVALRTRNSLKPIEYRRAQLTQPRERELHLGLDAGHANHRQRRSRGRGNRVLQQRRLTHAGVPSEHEHPAVAGKRPVEQPIELSTLVFSTAQHGSGAQ